MKKGWHYDDLKHGKGFGLMKTTLLFLLILMSSSAYSANWYVDNAVVSSGNGQSWASAFKDFSNIAWSSINPGDTLYISGGVTSQTYTSPLNVGTSGTASNRITIRAGQEAGHNGMVTFDAGAYISAVNYVTIDGSVGTNSRITIKNVSDLSSKDNGWAIYGDGKVGVTIRYVTITNCNNGINLTYGDAFEVDHNFITVKGDVGVRSFANPTRGWVQDTNLIHDNVLTSLNYNGGPDTIQSGDSTNIYNNTFRNVVDASSLPGQHPDNIQMGGRYVKVYGNTFIDVGDSNIDYDAQGSGEIQDVYIYNNLFHIVTKIDEYPDFIRMYSTGKAINIFSNVKILNNTFIVDSGELATYTGQLMGFGFGNGTGAGSGNEIKNNLASGTGNMGINHDTGGGSWTVSWGNNIYPIPMALDPSGIVGVPSLDASFIPTVTDTLARDQGVTMSYFSTDKLGTPRPQGSAWDIGAFEYTTNAPVKLAAPTNLRIQ
ncbi:MAG: choice-of-anchor Q domain-containing protein [Pseudobdellovibrionaceae bacterium]